MTNTGSIARTGAVLLHPHGDFRGNLLWPGNLPVEHLAELPGALREIRARGYEASPFPEGDGVTFGWRSEAGYDSSVSAVDFSESFPFLDIEVHQGHGGVAEALARLSGDRRVSCRYLLPVQNIHFEASFRLGETHFHAPVDGQDNFLADHAWRELCNIPGADVNPEWAPGKGAHGTTELLGYPLVEREIDVPLNLLYSAQGSHDSATPLLRLLMEDADHALDPLRIEQCHYHRLQYLPEKPGWVGDSVLAYIKPVTRSPKAGLITGKPYVVRASNVWLGLEVNEDAALWAAPYVDIVDSRASDEITLALKSALRALNRAFYLAELEASFLHLVYAVDALCDPGKLTGARHRLWITAFRTGGDPADFQVLLDKFDYYYAIRNSIVHRGETFATLGLAGEGPCQFMLDTLRACIETFLINSFPDRRKAAHFSYHALANPILAPVVAGAPDIASPIGSDKPFKKHMDAYL